VGKKKRRRRPGLFTLLFFLVLIALGAALVAAMPIWTIKEVVVNGAQMLDPDEIRGLAGIPLGENLFYTSFAKAIKSYHFYRIPPATVLISLEEREPLAFVIFPQYSAVIDRAGIVINRNQNLALDIPNSVDLPVVTGISQQKFLQGEKLDGSATTVIVNILDKLSPYLAKKKLQLELGELENISFLLDDLLRVKLGKAEEIWRKMEVVGGLLPVVKDKWPQVEYIDIRFPDNPVIKYK
jgi:cell division septal protein FtsQ